MAKLPRSIQGQNGSADLMRAARSLVWGFAIDEDDAADIILADFNPECVPPWSIDDVEKACDNAGTDGTNPRGWLLARSLARDGGDRPPHDAATVALANAGFGPPPAGTPPGGGPEGERPASPPEPNLAGFDEDDPERIACLVLRAHHHPEGPTLRHWRDQWYLWERGCYRAVPDGEVANRVVAAASAEFARTHAARLANPTILDQVEKGGTVKIQPKKKVTTSLVRDTLMHLRCQTELRVDREPCWVDEPDRKTADVIPFTNGLLDLPAFANGSPDAFRPPTPRFFTQTRADFAFARRPAEPTNWLKFLDSVWGDDPASVKLLQEWFGYLITADVSMHKMLMLIGPPRAGKGTIREVITQIVGERNVAAPTLGMLADRFGLHTLTGKSVAIVADARLSGRPDREAISERLLSITGGDQQEIDRKNRDTVTAHLNARFVLFSNEVPRLPDSSRAIMTRLCMLHLSRSFEGREDRGLIGRILPEMPAVFLWAVEGWKRLQQKRRFTRPESAQELFDQAEAMASPIHSFVEERCDLEPDEFTATQALFDAWLKWCEKGNRIPGDIGVFGRNLRAACTAIKPGRPRSTAEDKPRTLGYYGIRLLSEYELGTL